MYANGAFKNPFADFDFSKFAGELKPIFSREGNSDYLDPSSNANCRADVQAAWLSPREYTLRGEMS